MKTEDIIGGRLSAMPYSAVLAKVRSIREGRVTPVQTNKTKAAKRGKKKTDEAESLFDDLSPEAQAILLEKLKAKS